MPPRYLYHGSNVKDEDVLYTTPDIEMLDKMTGDEKLFEIERLKRGWEDRLYSHSLHFQFTCSVDGREFDDCDDSQSEE